MKIIILFATLIASLAFGLAQDEERHVNTVVVKSAHFGHGHGDATVVYENKNGKSELELKLDGETLNFDPDAIAVGETQSFTLANGKTVDVMRTEDALVIHHGEGEPLTIRTFDGGHGEHDVMFLSGEGHGLHEYVFDHDALSGDAVVISGVGELDEDAKQVIIDALRQAGVEKEVHFANGPKLLWFDDSGEEHNLSGRSFHFSTVGDKTVEIKGGKGKILVIDKDKRKEKN